MVIGFDLDDTLYKEQTYVDSARAVIAAHLEDKYGMPYHEIYDMMMPPKAMFHRLEPLLARKVPEGAPENIGWLVDQFRHHKPNIELPADSRRTLTELKKAGHRLVLVTDGRVRTQMSKITTLGLDEFFAPDCIYISEAVGSEKGEGQAFRIIERRWPEEKKVFVGDNSRKDFLWPNKLGWMTFRLEDPKNINIHPDWAEAPDEYRAQRVIQFLSQISDIFAPR